VASVGVVAVLEFVQLLLEYSKGGGFRLLGKETFQGLMESFDISLGLGMPRRTVFLDDAESAELVFKLVVSFLKARGVDDSVEPRPSGWRGSSDQWDSAPRQYGWPKASEIPLMVRNGQRVPMLGALESNTRSHSVPCH
jgi:hypothetical protein